MMLRFDQAYDGMAQDPDGDYVLWVAAQDEITHLRALLQRASMVIEFRLEETPTTNIADNLLAEIDAALTGKEVG